MKIWIEGARPKTWIASLSPVLIGGTLALDLHPISLITFLGCLMFALTLQIGTNFANDYLDFLKGTDTTDRKGPRRLVQSGLVPVKKMQKAACAMFVSAGVIGIGLMFVGGFLIGGLALLAIGLGFFYTGGPYPLGYLGLGDVLVLIFFGPVATGGVFYLLTGSLSWLPIVAGVSPGLLSTALLALNNLRDWASDQKSQKRSLIVRFGIEFGQWECALCLLIALCNPLFMFSISQMKRPWSLAGLAPLVLALPLIQKIFKDPSPEALAPLFPKVGKVFFFFTLFFCLGWLL